MFWLAIGYEQVLALWIKCMLCLMSWKMVYFTCSPFPLTWWPPASLYPFSEPYWGWCFIYLLSDSAAFVWQTEYQRSVLYPACTAACCQWLQWHDHEPHDSLLNLSSFGDFSFKLLSLDEHSEQHSCSGMVNFCRWGYFLDCIVDRESRKLWMFLTWIWENMHVP